MRCDLSNGESPCDFKVDGVKPSTSGNLRFEADQSAIRKVQAYCDECGVFNIFVKDEEGNVITSYDPKPYGEISTGKIDIEPEWNIIGVYGTQPNSGSNIFSSLGLVLFKRIDG